MLEDYRPVAGKVLIKGDAVTDTAEKFGECRLALFEWLRAQVGAIKFKQIESA
jgi:hypothetical protein